MSTRKLVESIEAGLAPGFEDLPVNSQIHLFLAALIFSTGGENHYLKYFGDGSWVVQHPITERLDGSLFDCKVHEAIASVADQIAVRLKAGGVYMLEFHGPSGVYFRPGIFKGVNDT